MRKRKRDKHTVKNDKQGHMDELAKEIPNRRAREWMHRPAYQTEKLSYQARFMIRRQGQQMEHMEVNEYVRRRREEKCGDDEGKARGLSEQSGGNKGTGLHIAE